MGIAVDADWGRAGAGTFRIVPNYKMDLKYFIHRYIILKYRSSSI